MMPNITTDSQTETSTRSEPIIVNPSSHNLSKSILIGIIIFVLLATVACGTYWYSKNYLVTFPSKFSVQTVSPETSQPKNSFSNLNDQATPSATDETAGWKTYTNEKYSYALKYPGTWYDLPSYGAPDNDKYFSNENIGAPLEGSAKLIWLAVRITSNYNKSQYDKIKGIFLNSTDGLQVIKVIKETPPKAPTEYAYETQYFVYRNNNLYSLDFITPNKEGGIENENLFDQILSTFKFLP